MNVLMIVVDSLRGDAPGYAGGEAHTPFLDRLAKEGAHSQEAFASAAWTVPSLMSMLTGMYAHRVGIGRWRHPYPNKLPNLLTAFSSAGFQVSCFHPYPNWGFVTIPGKTQVQSSQDPKAVCAALKGEKGKDRFVLVHHWWTHLPYINRLMGTNEWHATCDFTLESLNKHPEKVRGTVEKNYRNAVSFFSEELLPRYIDAATQGGEDTLVIITGDHGETFGDSLPPDRRINNVYDLHGRWITDETIRVPLLFWSNGCAHIPSGTQVNGIFRGVDMAPTIADLCNVPWPGPGPHLDGEETVEREFFASDLVGRSLAGCICKNTNTGNSDAITLTSHNAYVPRTYPDNGLEMWRTFALRSKTHWYAWDGPTESTTVQSLGEDEGLVGEKEIEEIVQRLAQHRSRCVNAGPGVSDSKLDELRTGSPGESEVVVERLRTLGYLE